MQTKDTIQEMQGELQKTLGIWYVSYEYPGFFVIYGNHGVFHLGRANDCWGWNDLDGKHSGETLQIEPVKVVQDFVKWMNASHK